jgi:hypothetical protein
MERDPNEEVEGLISWLRGQGFHQVHEDYSEQDFGNWARELHGSDVWVRVVRERGEWLLDAAISGSIEWFGMDAWSECLATNQVFQGTTPREQSEFLRQHLSAMKKAASGDRALLGCLEGAQRRILTNQFGPLPKALPGQTMKLAPPADDKSARHAAARLAQEQYRRRKSKS